jgi:hypothetical protein
LPVRKDVEAGVWLEFRLYGVNPTLCIGLVVIIRQALKVETVILLVEVVGRVHQGQVGHSIRQLGEDGKRVAIDTLVFHLLHGCQVICCRLNLGKDARGRVCKVKIDCLVPGRLCHFVTIQVRVFILV